MQTRKKSVTVKSGYRLKVKERLRESEINFVFCEWELYVGTAPEQKTESAKNGKDSMSLPFFQSLRVQQVAPTVSPPGSVGASALKCRGLHRRPAPFAREAKRFIFYYSARFSRFVEVVILNQAILLFLHLRKQRLPQAKLPKLCLHSKHRLPPT